MGEVLAASKPFLLSSVFSSPVSDSRMNLNLLLSGKMALLDVSQIFSR